VLNTLLLSRDPTLIGILQSVCTNGGLTSTVCSGSPEVAAVLARCKFYAVIVDSAEADVAKEVLSAVRASSSSRNATSIVVSDASADLLVGTFVLRKPVAVDLAVRTLRAAKGPMLNEFRRYFRHAVKLPAVIMRDSGGEFQATSINLSQVGLAVQMPGPHLIVPKDAVRARITLPGAATSIETKGKVAWADAKSRAGLFCEGYSPRDRKQLEEWLAPRLPGKWHSQW
jgi:PilZ domain